MKRIVTAGILGILALSSIAIPCLADDPTTDVDIAVISGNANVTVDIASTTASVNVNGIGWAGVSISGANVLEELNWRTASVDSVKKDNKAQWTAINKNYKELQMTEEAVARLILNDSEKQMLLQSVGTDLQNTKVAYDNQLKSLESERYETCLRLDEAETVIDSQQQLIAKMESRIQSLEDYNYQKEHSGFWYNFKQFVGKIFGR